MADWSEGLLNVSRALDITMCFVALLYMSRFHATDRGLFDVLVFSNDQRK